MKEAEYKKPINTIPDGVWESSRPQKHNTTQTKTNDLQGNGYLAEQLQILLLIISKIAKKKASVELVWSDVIVPDYPKLEQDIHADVLINVVFFLD